ncbi:MAG: hypothetical protein JJT89_08125 [Nitriliruptoraceae bacterium]|nr:hypothetical protein [Nitriliruptoraceae bacterium]
MRVRIHPPVLSVALAALVLAGCGPADLTSADPTDEAAADEATDEPTEPDEPADDPAEDEDADEPEEGDPAQDDADPDGSTDAEAAGEPTTACTDADTMLEAGVPDIAERVEQVTGDLTGDGLDDTVTTYAIGDDDDAVFLLRMETASGFVVERSLDDATALAAVQPLGVRALGGTRGVAFVIEQTSASGPLIGLYALHDTPDAGCALLPVTIPDTSTSRLFAVGGSVSTLSGLRCVEGTDGAGALAVTDARSDGADGYDWVSGTYTWPDGGELLDADLALGEGDDLDTIEDRLGFACGDMTLP